MLMTGGHPGCCTHPSSPSAAGKHRLGGLELFQPPFRVSLMQKLQDAKDWSDRFHVSVPRLPYNFWIEQITSTSESGWRNSLPQPIWKVCWIWDCFCVLILASYMYMKCICITLHQSAALRALLRIRRITTAMLCLCLRVSWDQKQVPSQRTGARVAPLLLPKQEAFVPTHLYSFTHKVVTVLI